MFVINWLMRWLHVTAAVAGVGGGIAMRFVVLPALAARPDGAEIAEAIRVPFKRLFHLAMGLLLITGFYNYLYVSIPRLHRLRDEGIANISGAYHGVMGGKILLSLVLFGIGIALLKPVPAMHENRKTWLSVNTVLGLLILLLGAYLRRIWP